MTSNGSATGRGDRWLTVLFLCIAGAFAAAAILLAAINRSPGSPDSLNNLDTARSLASGTGFRSNIVQQLFVEIPLPGPETFRPPGAAFVTGAAFRLFGVSMATPVLLNGAVLLLAALLLRVAIRASGAPRIASLAGILFLLSANFRLISVWNNNYLTLCTTALLLCGSLYERGRGSPWIPVAIAGVIGAVGFLMKPTFLISVIPFAAFLLFVSRGPAVPSFRRQGIAFILFLAVMALVASPYWTWSLARFGHPAYSQVPAVRLSERYGGLPCKTWWTVRFDRPVTYGELAEIHGTVELMRKEVSRWLRAVVRIVRLNPPVAILAAPGLYLLLRSRTWRRYALPALLMAEPLFSGGLYARPDKRYFWPAFPCLLFIVGLIVQNGLHRTGRDTGYGPDRRRTWLVILLLGCGIAFGVYRTQREWRRSFADAGRPVPAWGSIVRTTPPDAVILTDDPWSVAWVAERPAVICPGGDRADLLEVLRRYRPDYYLHAGRGYGGGKPAFEEGDLEPVPPDPRGEAPWAFHRLTIPIPEQDD